MNRRAAFSVLSLAVLSLYVGGSAVAAIPPLTSTDTKPQAPAAKPSRAPRTLVDRLSIIRERVIGLQQNLLDSLKSEKQVQTNMKKLQQLIALQRHERALGKERLAELEKTVAELEGRRALLNDKIHGQQREISAFLVAIGSSLHEPPRFSNEMDQERLEAPRRKVLGNLIDRGLKEIESLKADLTDADQIEVRIQDEKEQLAYLFQDLDEQQSVLELNRQLQSDLLKRKQAERIAQLENYRKLKNSEAQVEHLIGQFNARLELQRTAETERAANRENSRLNGGGMTQGLFAQMKGKLSLPIPGGKVISAFGRSYDLKSRLHVFKKGVDIAAGKNMPVYAVSAGKTAFVGELPEYGRVAIIDHGDHYYTLCAHLGEFAKKAGDPVAAGDPIGVTDDLGTPVYFEIRARNVAVNPLQWLSN